MAFIVFIFFSLVYHRCFPPLSLVREMFEVGTTLLWVKKETRHCWVLFYTFPEGFRRDYSVKFYCGFCGLVGLQLRGFFSSSTFRRHFQASLYALYVFLVYFFGISIALSLYTQKEKQVSCLLGSNLLRHQYLQDVSFLHIPSVLSISI